jgi:hypothetical protein
MKMIIESNCIEIMKLKKVVVCTITFLIESNKEL